MQPEDRPKHTARFPWIRRLDYYETLGSTNDRGLQLAEKDTLETPLLVWAQRQTAGRGRGDNRWRSREGALTFSLVLESPLQEAEPARWPQIALVIGLAIRKTLGELAPELEVLLKWPNDVYANGKKICGVLVETVPGPPCRLVAGIGVNVNNAWRGEQAEADVLQTTATSLLDETERTWDRGEVLAKLLGNLQMLLEEWSQETLDWVALWRKSCLLSGRRVRIETGAKETQGICLGIDSQGALLVETPAGVQTCWAGTVRIVDR